VAEAPRAPPRQDRRARPRTAGSLATRNRWTRTLRRPRKSSRSVPRRRQPTPRRPRARAAPTAADLGNEKAAYDEAFGSLREGRYAESARRFQEFLQRYPESDLSDNAHYWLGESYYVTQNYKVAQETFQLVLKRYPQSPKAPDAMLKVGYCQFELRDWANAEATLNEVIRRYPDTTVSRLAEGRLRALRVESRR
jgi:tol-pal system protein YbgF